MTVFGVYWGRSNGVWQRLYYVIDDYPGDSGFSAYDEDSTILVDYRMDNFLLIKLHDIGDMFIHEAAYSSIELFQELIEWGNQNAVEQLFGNMRELGLEPI
ncbi:hypothetical protein CQ054_22980 [Ochrobactrum sp. MYb29]|nr:hypothetical protein CQ054_22980 [Ochrobactrum sp. MYb29]